MSSESTGPLGEVVVDCADLSKCYHVYRRPQDRLRQFFARRDRRHYTEFWALRDFDLQVYRGETLGIVGRNGAGKSTLLQLIAGTLKPTAGVLEVHGRVTALLELGSGFHHEFTGRENVYVAGALLGLDREEMDARMQRIESFADIGAFIDRPVKTYSKGMFARLSFSVYANLDPEVFIVDEALAVGDARFRHKCMYRFKQMQDQGVSILYVSHDAPSMKHVCDRVVWIDQGRLRLQGPADEVVDAYLTDLFHGEVTRSRQAEEGPKFDGRAGSGDCRIVATTLVDGNDNETDHLTPHDEYQLLMTIENFALCPERDTLRAGFWIRNARGVTVTGSNTEILGAALPTPAAGDRVRVRFRLRPPRLAAGSYSVTVMTSSLDDQGQPVLCDRLVNVLVLKVSSGEQMPGLVGLDCSAEVMP